MERHSHFNPNTPRYAIFERVTGYYLLWGPGFLGAISAIAAQSKERPNHALALLAISAASVILGTHELTTAKILENPLNAINK